MTTIEVTGLRKRFGPTQALDAMAAERIVAIRAAQAAS
jgi:hypothetical protein